LGFWPEGIEVDWQALGQECFTTLYKHVEGQTSKCPRFFLSFFPNPKVYFCILKLERKYSYWKKWMQHKILCKK
jgi:hypothetical protein